MARPGFIYTGTSCSSHSKCYSVFFFFFFFFFKIFWLGMTTNERLNMSRYAHFSDNNGMPLSPFRYKLYYCLLLTELFVYALKRQCRSETEEGACVERVTNPLRLDNNNNRVRR